MWSFNFSEVLRCCYDRKNYFDFYVIVVMKRFFGRFVNIIIGYLLREIFIIIYFFLLKGGVVSICESVIGINLVR